jgi:phosphohistidine phosphatase
MEIYILRHGIAEEAQAGKPDSERALTEEGRHKLRQVLERAATAGAEPTLILSSPYRRAVETARLASQLLECGEMLKTQALLPNSAPEDVWQEIRTHRQEKSLLLAGHEPLLSQVAAYLLGAPGMQIDMKKAGLLRIDQDGFHGPPRGVLKWMLTPRLI